MKGTENPFAVWRRMRREAKAAGRPMEVGEWVARLAQPVAERIDARLGTDLTGCEGCAADRARLNGHGGSGATAEEI